MKRYLRNLLLGVPLALGALLTLISVVQILADEVERLPAAVLCGLLGIPLLFATLAAICARGRDS